MIDDLLTRCAFPATPTLTCAVSGGPDSTALLALAVATGRVVTAVHVDHGLRPTSDDEAARVVDLAARWGAGVEVVSAPVADGPNLEERARAARHRAVGPEALFGHTADDQAETVVLRLIRGTGPAGLAAMRLDRHPLLGLRRADTLALCTHLRVDPVEDPSNDDPRFTRNRVRHEVLPLLDDIAGRDVVPLLARLADLSASQADLVGALALGVDPTDAAALARAPRPLATASVRRWWGERTGGSPPPDAAAVDRVLAVAAGDAVACEVVAGWRVSRTAGRLRLEPCRPLQSPE